LTLMPAEWQNTICSDIYNMIWLLSPRTPESPSICSHGSTDLTNFLPRRSVAYYQSLSLRHQKKGSSGSLLSRCFFTYFARHYYQPLEKRVLRKKVTLLKVYCQGSFFLLATKQGKLDGCRTAGKHRPHGIAGLSLADHHIVC
jgi:hypothetical protein